LSEAEGGDARPSARADFYSGIGWVALGGAIAVASWNMDRLERLGVSFFTAPGLVPGVLGVLLAAGGFILLARAVREGALAGGQRPPVLLERNMLRRGGIALVLALAFTLGLVGHGLPFPAAAGAYLFVQVALLQYPERKAKGEVLRGLVVAAIFAACAAAVVSFIFQEVFLVRLP
jgi:hypothetical protein